MRLEIPKGEEQMQFGAQKRGLAWETEGLGGDGEGEVKGRVVGTSSLMFYLFEVVK